MKLSVVKFLAATNALFSGGLSLIHLGNGLSGLMPNASCPYCSILIPSGVILLFFGILGIKTWQYPEAKLEKRKNLLFVANAVAALLSIIYVLNVYG
ncbi:MAG: hypothetical protein JKX84_11155 [Flavobacteriales bacterium]|nr:hypothetical protein [Flavobacteriales bacterium]